MAELAGLSEVRRELPFPVEEYERRQALTRERMVEAGLDLLVVSSPEGIAWLCGHALRWNKGQSPTAWPALQCLVLRAGQERSILFETAEHEHMIRAYSMVEDFRLSEAEDLDRVLAHIVGELAGEGWLSGVVGVEKWSYIPNRAVGEAMEAALRERGVVDVVDASVLMRRVRSAKSDLELAYIERAAAAVDAGLLALEGVIRPGVREIDLWVELMRGMVAAGGEPAGLHELVTFERHTGHSFSSDRRLRAGDIVEADPSGVVQHYHANIAMSWYVGEMPDEVRRLTEAAGGAYEVLRAEARAGVTIGRLGERMREYYEGVGLWDPRIDCYVGGYELGLSFPPDWVGEIAFTVGTPENADVVLEENQVFNYESNLPFLMIDTFVVGREGSRTLSGLPHRMREVHV
ncbi:aminopeptidase P family protein [Leucobacter sp. CSA1]|uniref:Aminopeptidase P family protein n=1 Tax=Leucobacter chromiisoli TaxID=2796471 RepID=A0A934Q8Z4_9MICO|nr:Xaa-Pro peptidase family protein [Leucobacter chromiisoli]MBK0420420.1 aminopeptidase P family protein [Leucobacter chromiisoli]